MQIQNPQSINCYRLRKVSFAVMVGHGSGKSFPVGGENSETLLDIMNFDCSHVSAVKRLYNSTFYKDSLFTTTCLVNTKVFTYTLIVLAINVNWLQW